MGVMLWLAVTAFAVAFEGRGDATKPTDVMGECYGCIHHSHYDKPEECASVCEYAGNDSAITRGALYEHALWLLFESFHKNRHLDGTELVRRTARVFFRNNPSPAFAGATDGLLSRLAQKFPRVGVLDVATLSAERNDSRPCSIHGPTISKRTKTSMCDTFHWCAPGPVPMAWNLELARMLEQVPNDVLARHCKLANGEGVWQRSNISWMDARPCVNYSCAPKSCTAKSKYGVCSATLVNSRYACGVSHPALQWEWVPAASSQTECAQNKEEAHPLPRRTPGARLVTAFANKTTCFWGDSLTENQHDSLVNEMAARPGDPAGQHGSKLAYGSGKVLLFKSLYLFATRVAKKAVAGSSLYQYRYVVDISRPNFPKGLRGCDVVVLNTAVFWNSLTVGRVVRHGKVVAEHSNFSAV